MIKIGINFEIGKGCIKKSGPDGVIIDELGNFLVDELGNYIAY